MPSSIEYVRPDKLRAIAVTTSTRSEALPNIRTVGEFVPGPRGERILRRRRGQEHARRDRRHVNRRPNLTPHRRPNLTPLSDGFGRLGGQFCAPNNNPLASVWDREIVPIGEWGKIFSDQAMTLAGHRPACTPCHNSGDERRELSLESCAQTQAWPRRLNGNTAQPS
jgi:hypothetical protein